MGAASAWADRLIIAREASRALGRIAVDALADLRGGAASDPGRRALPLSPSDLLDERSGLASLLDPSELLGRPAERWPRSIAITDQVAPSSNCQNSALRIEADDGAGPASIFVKQPSADLATRIFANVIGFWRIECAVCRNLAGRMPIDTPRIHAVREAGSRFLIVMENLAERPGIRLHVNREMVPGIAPDDARRCIETLARLHAGFSGLCASEREAALPLSLHPHRSPSLRPIMLAVNRQAAEPCHRKAPGVFTEPLLDLYRRALARWDAMEAAWYGGPATLVHGDSHWGNFFETDEGVGMLDFQGAHFGAGIRDVQYLLINSMAADVLAEQERDLVEHYVKRVGELGAPIASDVAWQQYRGFSFQTLMTAVVSTGLGSFTDSDEVMRCMLERSCAALRRLDFEGWLAGL